MMEPVYKEEWKRYLDDKLAMAERRVAAVADPVATAETRSEIEELQMKIRVLQFDIAAWAASSGYGRTSPG